MDKLYSKLDREEFKKRIGNNFPGIYLTIISVIQGVALGLLVQSLFKGGIIVISRIPYALISFGTIIAVFWEYIWFVGIYRWSPRISDIITPLFLGVSEIIPLFFFDNPRYWWFFNFVLCFVGSIAFLNTLIHCRNDKFCDKDVFDLTRRGIYRQIFLTISMAIISLITVFIFQKTKVIYFWYLLEIIVFIIYISLTLILIIKDQMFIKEVHKKFNFEY